MLDWHSLIIQLKERASDQRLSLSFIASQTGYSTSTLMRIFNLEFCPKLNIYLDIAKCVGVDVSSVIVENNDYK